VSSEQLKPKTINQKLKEVSRKDAKDAKKGTGFSNG
jgi:hypothetical protein